MNKSSTIDGHTRIFKRAIKPGIYFIKIIDEESRVTSIQKVVTRH